MADKSKDPTVKSGTGERYPEGTHPAVPISEGSHYAGDKRYGDNPDKPGPDSVAQVEVTE